MNADHKLSFVQRFYWMVQVTVAYLSSAWIKLNPSRRDNLSFRKCTSKGMASPTRIYTENLIYEYIPWKKYLNEFDKISICELGCGDLRYLDLFNEILGEGNFRYCGIEAPDFELSPNAQSKLNNNVSFLNYDLNRGIPTQVKDCNVFVSFSVLEHIDDLDQLLSNYKKLTRNASYHHHSVPTYLSVVNYLWHGCRHFTKREINKLVVDSSTDTREVVFYGGAITIISHLFLITILDICVKFFNVSPRIRIIGSSWAQKICLKLELIDNLSTKFGLHTFCMVSWRSLDAPSMHLDTVNKN